MRTFTVLLLAGVVLVVLVLGGTDWLKAEADRAAAHRIQAEAAKARAEYDGKATLAVAQAQADSMRANAALPVLTIILAVLACASVGLVAVAAIRTRGPSERQQTPVVHVYQVSQPDRRNYQIDTPYGVLELPVEPGETRAAYLLRVQEIAASLGGGRLLPPS